MQLKKHTSLPLTSLARSPMILDLPCHISAYPDNIPIFIPSVPSLCPPCVHLSLLFDFCQEFQAPLCRCPATFAWFFSPQSDALLLSLKNSSFSISQLSWTSLPSRTPYHEILSRRSLKRPSLVLLKSRVVILLTALTPSQMISWSL